MGTQDNRANISALNASEMLHEILPPKQFRHVAGLAVGDFIVIPGKQLSRLPEKEWYGAILYAVDQNDDQSGYYRQTLYRQLIESVRKADRDPLVELFSQRYPNNPSEVAFWKSTAKTTPDPKPPDIETTAQIYVQKAIDVGLHSDTVAEKYLSLPPRIVERIKILLRKEGIEVSEPQTIEDSLSCCYLTKFEIKSGDKRAHTIREKLVSKIVETILTREAQPDVTKSEFFDVPMEFDGLAVQEVVVRLKTKGYIVDTQEIGHTGGDLNFVVSKRGVDKTVTRTVTGSTKPVASERPKTPIDETEQIILSSVIGDPALTKKVEELVTSHDLFGLIMTKFQQGKEEEAVKILERVKEISKGFENPKSSSYVNKLLSNASDLPWGRDLRSSLRKGIEDF